MRLEITRRAELAVRAMAVLGRAGDRDLVRVKAGEYLRRYPDGRRARTMRGHLAP